MNSQQFCVVLIKPSHYDGDGYVIQWHRSIMPSNTLTSTTVIIALALFISDGDTHRIINQLRG